MAVLVQGVGPVPSSAGGLGVTVYPSRPVALDWHVAMKLVDWRMAQVVGYEDSSEFVGTEGIYWLSPFSQGDGYATAAESMVYWLAQHGLGLSVHHSWFLVKEGLRSETLAMLRSPDPTPYRVGVCMATPGEFEKLPTPYKIGFTMYESTDPLKVYPEWRHQCNGVDRLFVPSAFCAELFSEFVHRPINVVPLAIHEAYCEPVLRQAHDTFRVVSFATLTGRKGPIEMIDVFRNAFPDQEDVEFILKTRLKLLGSQTPGLPEMNDRRIKVVDGTWPLARVQQFLLNADCMMFLSKGEGFGMTPREAMATGCPTILADNTGMSDVCDKRYNWPVPTSHLENSPLGGKWFIPDYDYAVDVLRWMYSNRERAYEKAYRGAEWFIATHGPSHAAEKFVDTLRSVDTSPGPVPSGHINVDMSIVREWVELVKKTYVQFGIQTRLLRRYGELRDFQCSQSLVVMCEQVMSATREQIEFAVNTLLHNGAKYIMLVAPSVHMVPTDDATKYWRLEELQYVLRGKHVPMFKYVSNRRWVIAVVAQEVGKRLPGFGSVVDRRWRPT